MPIRPENKSRYPKNWKQIRERIMGRAGEQRNKAGAVMGEAKCEWCGVINHSFGTRKANGDWVPLGLMEAEVAHLDGEKVVQIVLTIAHVHDHAPENCADDNLAALCQRCHNRHDAPHRRRGRLERQVANTGSLFSEPPTPAAAGTERR